MLNIHKKQHVLPLEEIISYYKSNIKKPENFKIGLEYEQLSLKINGFKNANYTELLKIIKHFADIQGWGILKDEGVVIGAMKGGSSISLEPGGQFEISLEPKTELSEIEKETTKILGLLNSIAKIYDVMFLPYGITPVSKYKDIEMVPKNRYLIMEKYFKEYGGKFAPVMMKQTAGVQINFDYDSEEDALLKLQVAALISPFVTGFFANSPFYNGKISSYKSFRALGWLFTDKARCGLFYKTLLKKRFGLNFEDYIRNIITLPMLFIQREGKKIPIEGKINFKTFMEEGYKGITPELNDYILHSSLTFPDVRLKNCLEIRNHDSQKLPLALSICAFYKGILYNKKAIEEVLNLLDFSSDEVSFLAFQSAKNGLSYNVKGTSAFEITKNLFEISKNFLSNEESKFLIEPLKMLEEKKCVSDLILEKQIKTPEELIKYINRI